jgi:hypothetical protein
MEEDEEDHDERPTAEASQVQCLANFRQLQSFIQKLIQHHRSKLYNPRLLTHPSFD